MTIFELVAFIVGVFLPICIPIGFLIADFILSITKLNKRINDNNKVIIGGCIGFMKLLTIIFINLKLLGIINWTWLLIFSPIWIPLIITLFIILIFNVEVKIL